MMKRLAAASPDFKARIAGVLSLLGLLAAVFGEFIVRRWEIAGDLIAVVCMVAVTLLLYDIFKPVNSGLSLLGASCNLVGLTCGALRWNPRGVDIPVVLNGFYCLLFGYLIFRSTFLLRILGALMAIGGLGWLTYMSPSLANRLSPYNLGSGILGQESVDAVAPRDGRERSTMEGAGQSSGQVTNSLKSQCDICPVSRLTGT